jgi:hypothetical protein
MEAICSSETSVDFHRTTRRYILEDGTLHACMWFFIFFFITFEFPECRELIHKYKSRMFYSFFNGVRVHVQLILTPNDILWRGLGALDMKMTLVLFIH